MGRSQKVILTAEASVLKRLRAESGLSMRAAGSLTGYSDSYISQIENGRENFPKAEKLQKFLNAYKTNPKAFRERVRSFRLELTDSDLIENLLPKLSKESLKTIRVMAEQMARREF